MVKGREVGEGERGEEVGEERQQRSKPQSASTLQGALDGDPTGVLLHPKMARACPSTGLLNIYLEDGYALTQL